MISPSMQGYFTFQCMDGASSTMTYHCNIECNSIIASYQASVPSHAHVSSQATAPSQADPCPSLTPAPCQAPAPSLGDSNRERNLTLPDAFNIPGCYCFFPRPGSCQSPPILLLLVPSLFLPPPRLLCTP